MLLVAGCGARSGLLTGSFSNDVQTGGSHQLTGGNNSTQAYFGGNESFGGNAGVGALSTAVGGTLASGGVSQIIGSNATGGVTVAQAMSVSAGTNYTCALMSNGTVKCWGWNLYGRLGNGTTADSAKPTLVAGITSAIAISSGEMHACALLSDGTIRCWGRNIEGQLGNGSPTNSPVPAPVTVADITSAIAISAGYEHTCALLQDHTALCWGDNSSDQLGVDHNLLYSSSTPIVLSRFYNGIAAIGAGREHTCAIPMSDVGAVACWGDNLEGQLGDPSVIDDSSSPVTVIGVTSASRLAVGDQHNCALITGGTVQCWGYNYYGQLGNGSTANNSAANVFDISTATAITAADHTCALLSDGHVQCWGFNTSGELGDGSTTFHDTPVFVSGIDNAQTVSAGAVHTCALLDGAQLKCWGDNAYGELGDGTTTNSSVPVPVTDL